MNKNARIYWDNRYEKMMWQPIETAPRGELDALVIDVFGNIFHGFKGLNEKWSAENPAGGGDYYIRTGKITHWMPLPELPIE